MRRIGVGLEAIKSSIFRTFVAVERLRTPPGVISDPDFVIVVLARLNYGYSAAWVPKYYHDLILFRYQLIPKSYF